MRLYCDPASTASRPLLCLIAELALEVEVRPVILALGQHRTPEFLTINPNGQVPVLEDKVFRLTESGAILRYLGAGSPLVPDGRYERARFDEALDWFMTGFAKDFCAGVVYAQLIPELAHPDPAVQADLVTRATLRAERRFDVLDRHILARHDYVAGDALTAADYVGAAMVTLGEMVGFDITPYPRVAHWLNRIRAREGWIAGNAAFDAMKAAVLSPAA